MSPPFLTHPAARSRVVPLDPPQRFSPSLFHRMEKGHERKAVPCSSILHLWPLTSQARSQGVESGQKPGDTHPASAARKAGLYSKSRLHAPDSSKLKCLGCFKAGRAVQTMELHTQALSCSSDSSRMGGKEHAHLVMCSGCSGPTSYYKR